MLLNASALIALRESSGLSQAELARRTGLSQGHVSELERGDKQPRPATMQKLAAGLGVPLPALVSRNGSDGSARASHPGRASGSQIIEWLEDELIDALEDKERIERRIQRLKGRIARATAGQETAKRDSNGVAAPPGDEAVTRVG